MIEKYHLVGNIFMYAKIKTKENKSVFRGTKKKEVYLKFLEYAKNRYEVTIVAYCIVDNCIYLLLHAEDSNYIYDFIQFTEKQFMNYLRLDTKKVEAVFKSKKMFRSLIYESEIYKHISLIHKIPEMKNLVRKEDVYNYSSYKQYIKGDGMINVERIKTILNKKDFNIIRFLKIEHSNLKELDIEDNLKKVIKSYVRSAKITEEKLKFNKNEMKKLLAYMVKLNCSFSKNSIAEYLDITKATFYRYITEKRNEA